MTERTKEMKSLVFASRNFKELVRDPLSWVFCLGFPIIMLIVMTLVNESIPKEANMTIFEINSLAPAIGIFGLTFIMLFACLLISGDRKEAFLLRIFTSPMRSVDYITGYFLPIFILALGQYAINIIASVILGLIYGETMSVINILFSLIPIIPSAVLNISFGIIFGTILNKNAAPGIASIIISLSGILGGIWMDIETIGGVLADIANALPFYHSVKSARLAFSGDFSGSLTETGIVLIWAAAVTIIAIVVFRKKMRY